MRRLLVLGLLGLVACSDSRDPEDPPRTDLQATGRVQGQLTPFLGAGQQSARLPAALPPSRGGPSAREVARLVSRALPRGRAQARASVSPRSSEEEEGALPGEVILRFEERNLTPEQALQRVKLPGYRAVHKGYASEYLHLVAFEPSESSSRKTSARVSAAETERLVTQLSAKAGVRFAEPNRRVRSHAQPNDRGFAFQWHYPVLNLPAAWDVQQGNAGVVVAVTYPEAVEARGLSGSIG